jgi:hypothetical protein
MEEPLRTYLHDHLAGAGFAIEMLKKLEEQYEGSETGAFAAAILKDISEDRATLAKIAAKVGENHAPMKDALAWLSEKASRVKLQQEDPAGFRTFETVEILSLGILGKRSMWRALSEIATYDSRVAGFDYEALAARAQEQFARVEEYRLRLAASAFAPKHARTGGGSA